MPAHDIDLPTPAPKSQKHTWVWRIGGVAISLIALALVLASVDVSEAWAVLTKASLPYLMAVFGVLAFQFAVRGWRWRTVLPPRPDGRPIPVRRTIPPLLVGYLGNAVLPARLGEPIRAFLVARREKLDGLVCFGATMLERLVDTVTLALVGLVAAIVVGAEWWIVTLAAAVGLGGLVALGLLVAVGVTRLADIAAAILARIGLGSRTEKIQRWTRSFATGMDRGRKVQRLLLVMGASVVSWALDATIIFFVARSLDIELGYAGAIIVGAVAVLATAVPAAPGYVGTFELAATSAAVALGVPRAEALALAIVYHVITLVPIAVAGGLVLVASGNRLGRLAEEAEELEHEQLADDQGEPAAT